MTAAQYGGAEEDGIDPKEAETLRFINERVASGDDRGGGRAQDRGMMMGAGSRGGESMPLMPFKPIKRSTFTPKRRVYMNVVPILFNIFLPWMFFVLLASVLSFKFYHNHANLAWLFVGILCFVDVVVIGGLAFYADRGHEPTWFKYAALSCGVAIIAGTMFGYYNYYFTLFNFYAMQDLKTYPGVDVSLERGQNLMDAGRVYFAHGNHLEPNKAWHFKHGTTYCVAPIVGAGLPETGSYDFWAVGKDCCSVASSDFRCGAFDLPNARSGLRVLSMEERPYYRLAVQQAETAYGILASHPVFFEWTLDPLHRINEWRDTGFNHWLLACASYFSFCVFTGCLATYNFAWIGRGPDKRGP